MKNIKIITEPTVVVLADMSLDPYGLVELVKWLGEAAPACLPDDWKERLELEEPSDREEAVLDLIYPHARYRDEGNFNSITDNELLVELGGRKCYNSFGKKAGHADNAGYIANTMGMPGKIPHASIMYHAKMTFFFAGISRRMSHELIRHYVGADRTEEGCPSQESTRYTEHPGHFVAHPRMLRDESAGIIFKTAMQGAYTDYRDYLRNESERYQAEHGGVEPKGMDRKRIYEAAAMLLPGAAATSMIWTTNPVALAKLFLERCDEAADLEFQRFAKKLREVSYARWPNLFRESNPAAVK